VSDIDWGTAPEWVAGIATAAALILSLIILLREQQARREAIVDRRMRYAGGIAGWVESIDEEWRRKTVVKLPRPEHPICDTMHTSAPSPLRGWDDLRLYLAEC
jgi:hypothetical protein